MTAETDIIAARLAAASEVFPIAKPDDWDSTVRVTAAGDVITAVVTEHMGRAQRTYRAVLQPITDTETALVYPGAPTPGESRRDLNHPEEQKGMTSMTHTTPNLPVPAGATPGGWDSQIDGTLVRSLEWSRHDTDKVGVGVDGFQEDTGDVTRVITLYLDNPDLDAADARALAAKLIEAADAMDAL